MSSNLSLASSALFFASVAIAFANVTCAVAKAAQRLRNAAPLSATCGLAFQFATNSTSDIILISDGKSESASGDFATML